MRNIVLVFLIVSVAITSCSIKSTGFNGSGKRGDGTVESRSFSIDDYQSVNVGGAWDIYYEQKPDQTPYLRVEMDQNLLDIFDITIEGGCLYIRVTENINPTQCKIYTNSNSLQSVLVTGASTFVVNGPLNVQNLSVSVAGSGDFIAKDIEAENIDASIAGSGTVKLGGSTTNFSGSIVGSGDLLAFDLTADNAILKVAGSGDAKITVLKSLESNVTGSGDMRYKGDPVVKSNVFGSGSIKRVD